MIRAVSIGDKDDGQLLATSGGFRLTATAAIRATVGYADSWNSA